VVISAGFAETGTEGRGLEAQLVERIRAAGIRMIGPNCMGIINTDPDFKLNATFSPVYPPPGRVAFSTQSGALGLAILDYVKKLDLGISTFASIGNKADVSGNDLIQYWAEDERTDVILLYLESFGNPKKFGQIARRVGRRKPIVAVKAGRSTAGARAASSHTGARATSDALVDTLLRQAGVIRTHTLEELFDVAALLAHQPIPQGRRVAILTNAGGPGILAADACEANGLNLEALSPSTVEALRSFLPPAASVGNPVDMIASATPEQYRRALGLLLKDPKVDSVIVIFIPPLVTAAEDVAAAIRETVAGTTKPVARDVPRDAGGGAARAGPGVSLPRVGGRGAVARDALRRVAAQAGRAARLRDRLRPRGGARHRDARARGGRGWLDATDAQALLKAGGVAVAEARLARTPDEAAQFASEIGFPVALKADGPTLVHKTEVGGVKLGVASAQGVRETYADFATRLGDRLEGVLVQKMVTGGVEMVVGGDERPVVRPARDGGTGGIFVELVGDTVFRMCPLTEADAGDMVKRDEGQGAAARLPRRARRWTRRRSRVCCWRCHSSWTPAPRSGDGHQPGDGPGAGRGGRRRPGPHRPAGPGTVGRRISY
jgi:acetate---CoA ligase (ADP-forming)